VLDDETASELALFAGLEWREDDRDVLAPLIDATLLWLDDERLDDFAAPIVETLWADDLRGDIERALDAYGDRRRDVVDARADLALGPRKSRLAIAYVKQGAVDLSGAPLVRGRCLCCDEEGLQSVPAEKHEQIAAGAAAALVGVSQPDFGVGDPTDEARLRARKRLGDLAALAEDSLPRLAAAFRNFASEPLPPPGEDILWSAARMELYGDFTLPNQ
jgi:hypothetical protein